MQGKTAECPWSTSERQQRILRSRRSRCNVGVTNAIDDADARWYAPVTVCDGSKDTTAGENAEDAR
jgi:hypothetical protein